MNRRRAKFEPMASQKLSSLTPGVWVRASKYSQAHLISQRADGTAVCGRPCEPENHEWAIKDDEWAKCARCKGVDYSS